MLKCRLPSLESVEMYRRSIVAHLRVDLLALRGAIGDFHELENGTME